MNVIIIGAGEVGYELAESIRRKGHDVVIVDKREKACQRARTLDVKVIKGNGAQPELLHSIDIRSCDHFFAVTDDNEVNLVSCSLAKSAGCKTMARINGLEYISKPVSKRFTGVGVDYAVSPELIIAKKIANIITVPTAIDRNLSMEGKINVVEFKVLSKSKVEGKKLEDIDLPSRVNLGAIIRGNNVLLPHGKTKLKEGDTLIVMMRGRRSEKKLLRLMGKKKKKYQRALIVSATTIGINVAKLLNKRGIKVKILDNSKKRARRAAEKLKNVEVIRGDARDKRVLIEEGILRVDALASTDRSEEFNVLVSLLAKVYGVDKTIAVVRELGLKSLIETVGIEMAASPELQTAQTMLRLTRELNPLKAISLHRGDLYILEMDVTEDSKILGSTLDETELPEHSIVGALLREGRTLIPSGRLRFKEGDQVLVFVLKDEIYKVEELF